MNPNRKTTGVIIVIKTTLNQIKSFNPCPSGWRKLLNHLGKTTADDEAFPLATVLDSNGLGDTLWCLRVSPDIAAVFAKWCAERANAAAYAANADNAAAYAANADNAAARAAADAAYDAAYDAADAAYDAAYDAADAADAAYDAADAAYDAADAADAAYDAADAADAAYDAAYEKERQAQTEKLRELIS